MVIGLVQSNGADLWASQAQFKVGKEGFQALSVKD